MSNNIKNTSSKSSAVKQPVTSTPKVSATTKSTASTGAGTNTSRASEVAGTSQSCLSGHSILDSSKSQKTSKPNKVEQVRKRVREETLSSEGSLGASLIIDTQDEVVVKHEELKKLIDDAVQDAMKTGMCVVASKLEVSLRNIFTERFDLLESRIFDIETAFDNKTKALDSTVDSFKKESNQNLKALERRQNELDQKMKDTERLSIQNEFYIGSLENKVNDLEQYTRKNSIRIHGLKESVSGHENTYDLVCDYISNNLKIETDIEVAHRVGPKSRGAKPRSIIVKFLRRSDKLAVMLNRKLLKGSGVSFSDDLTSRNVKCINEVRENPRIESAWAWGSKLYAKGTNGHKFPIYPGIDIDSELDRHNKGN